MVKKKYIAACALLLAMSLTCTVSAQDTKTTDSDAAVKSSLSQLEEQRAQIDDKQKEIQELEKKISQLQNQRAGAAAQGDLIAAQVKKLSDQLAKAELELKQTQTSITLTTQEKNKTEQSLTVLNESVRTKKEQLKALVRSLYQEEQKPLISIFFDTFSLSDVLAQRAAYKELQDRTVSLVLAMKQEAEELSNKQQSLEGQYQQLQILQGTLASQQDEITSQKKEQQAFLKSKRQEEANFTQKIAEVEAAKEEIKKQVFTLKGTGVQLTLTNAFDIARFASKLTGVRASLLLGVLKVESNLGTNVGSGRYPDDMHPASRDAFLRITKQLGIDPYTTPVSRRPRSGSGWGGAMGPAQIMPATWESIQGRLSQLLNKPTPDPFNLTDAFVATAVFLADRGATNSAQEYEAVNKYIAGPYWQYHTWYGDRVLAVAAEYAKQGL